jgi:threonine/homoserine/homoserine lactone efflux protein
LIFVFNGLLVCLGYALAAGSLGAWLQTKPRASTWLNRAMAALFIGLGVRLALGSR